MISELWIFGAMGSHRDYIMYLLEKLTRENKVIVAAKKWNYYQFQLK